MKFEDEERVKSAMNRYLTKCLKKKQLTNIKHLGCGWLGYVDWKPWLLQYMLLCYIFYLFLLSISFWATCQSTLILPSVSSHVISSFICSSIFLSALSSQVVFQTSQTATAAANKMLMELADMPSLFFFRSFCQAFVDTLSFSLTHLRKKIHTIFHCRVR